MCFITSQHCNKGTLPVITKSTCNAHSKPVNILNTEQISKQKIGTLTFQWLHVSRLLNELLT